MKNSINIEKKGLINEKENSFLIDSDQEENDKIEFEKPKFLVGTEEEKISPSKKGTLMHLCLKNLNFSKNYEMHDIEELIEELETKKIITKKEAEAINKNQILNFTNSKIFNELKNAIEYHKEEPFYINIPAQDVMEVKCNTNILVQGIIDLYYIDKDDKLVLLDYKTDFIHPNEEHVLIDRHKKQLLLYKEALEGALNKKVDKIYIYSTTLGKEIEI